MIRSHHSRPGRGSETRSPSSASLAKVRGPGTVIGFALCRITHLSYRMIQSAAALIAILLLAGLAAFAASEPDYARVQQEIEQGNLPSAQATLQQALAANDADFEAHLLLGIVFQEEGRSGEALKQFDKARQLRPNDPAVYANTGRVLASQGSSSRRPGSSPLPFNSIQTTPPRVATGGLFSAISKDGSKPSLSFVSPSYCDRGMLQAGLFFFRHTSQTRTLRLPGRLPPRLSAYRHILRRRIALWAPSRAVQEIIPTRSLTCERRSS